MLCAIIGGIGNGKTLFMTHKALLHHLNGYRIISNYNLGVPYKSICSLEEIEKELKKNSKIDTYMAFDEGWITLDSRQSMAKKSVVWTRFMMQTRKVFFDVDFTAQHIGQLDTRIRNTCDRFYFPTIREWEGPPRKSKPLLMNVLCVERDVFGALVPFNNVLLKINDNLLNLYDTRESIRAVE